jgi:hypothetical protein
MEGREQVVGGRSVAVVFLNPGPPQGFWLYLWTYPRKKKCDGLKGYK